MGDEYSAILTVRSTVSLLSTNEYEEIGRENKNRGSPGSQCRRKVEVIDSIFLEIIGRPARHPDQLDINEQLCCSPCSLLRSELNHAVPYEVLLALNSQSAMPTAQAGGTH